MAPSQPRPRGRFRFAPSLRLEDSLSLAAFVMSLTITLINVYYSMRGSEIAVDQPAQLILYRDGSGDASVLTAAIRLDMINVSDGYGDVLKKASLSIDRGGTTFEYQGSIKTVFTSGADGTAPDCELGVRCIQLPGLYIVERSDEILDTPSGTARAFHLSFPLVSWNCAGPAKACDRFGAFSRSIDALPDRRLSTTVRLNFHSDGSRRLSCRTGPLNFDYLSKVGWITVPCVADAPPRA